MKYRYPFQFFFLLGLLLLKRSTIIHHVNQRPDAEHKLPSRMFCSEGFYLVGTLSATFSLLYQLHEFMFYIFRTLIVEQFGFFLILTPPLKKKQHPTTKEFILSNLSFIIDFLCCINRSYLYTLINQFCCHKTNISLVYYICTPFASFMSDSIFWVNYLQVVCDK